MAFSVHFDDIFLTWHSEFASDVDTLAKYFVSR